MCLPALMPTDKSSCSLTGVREASSSILHNTYATLVVSISYLLMGRAPGDGSLAGAIFFQKMCCLITAVNIQGFFAKILGKLATEIEGIIVSYKNQRTAGKAWSDPDRAIKDQRCE